MTNIMAKAKNVLASVALATSLAGTPALADSQEGNADVRTRIEASDSANQTAIKSTLGIGNPGRPYWEEYFRAYNFDKVSNGIENNYTAIGVMTPIFNFGELEHKTILTGNFGDKEGFALETFGKAGNLSTSLSFDMLTKPQQGTRIGGELNYSLDNTTIGAGFDSVSLNGITTNHYLVKGFADITKEDQIGAAFRFSDKEGQKTNSLVGYWVHVQDRSFGFLQNPGLRTYLKIENSSNGSNTYTFDTILAENSKLQGSGKWIVGRSACNGDMYDASIVTPALTAEATPLHDRSTGGLVARVLGTLTENNLLLGNIQAEAGYKFNITEGVSLTPTLIYRHDFLGNAEKDNMGASLLLDIGRNVRISGSILQPINGENSHPESYLSVQAIFPF